MNPFGVILIDKPKNITSFQVVHKIRSISKIKKVGHTGTLDPFATGLLPICIGKATRLSKYFLFDKKTYQVTAKFGIQTDTGDNTGKIIKTQEKILTDKDIESLKSIVLHLEKQIPPKYSAIKVNGKKAYQLARNNELFILPERKIKIFQFTIINFEYPYINYAVTVSKGTYIRTLTEQIAELLGTIATTTELRRTEVGFLDVDKSIPLNILTSSNWKDYLFTIENVLPNLPIKQLSDKESLDFVNGRRFRADDDDTEDLLVKDKMNVVLGIAMISDSILHPKIVLQNGFH